MFLNGRRLHSITRCARRLSYQFGRHSNAERKNELYETPECATRALLRREPASTNMEPAAGVARSYRCCVGAHEVVSDIPDYGDLHFVRDFLTIAPPLERS